MAIFTSNNYKGRTLELSISATPNPIDNTSTLNWTLTSAGGTSNYYSISETTIKINGTQVYHKGHTSWDTYVFPAKKGSTSGSLVVAHGTDGKKIVDVVFKTSVYRGVIEDYGGKMELPDIDRSGPTVSFSVSNITTDGFKISATASTKCDMWEYSTDNGSTWTSFSTTDATSASTAVTGLTVNTSYNVKVKARRTYNHVYGTSPAVTAKTLGQAAINSCPAFYADAETVTLNPNVTVYEASFTEKVIVKSGSTTLFTFGSFSWAAGTSNIAITLTDAQKQTLLQAMQKSTLTLSIVIETYSGSTLIGTSALNTVTAKTSNENSCPIWESPYISWEDTSDCADVTGDPTIMIQGYSHLVVTALGVTARNYAKLSTYTVTVADKTISSSSPVLDVGKIDTVGEHTLTLTVTDSRGHIAHITRNVTVLEYEPPKITKCTVRRANGIDDVIQLSFTASMHVIKPDGENDVNSLVNASYRYKLTSEGDSLDDYSDSVPITSDVVRSSTGTSLSFDTKQLLSLDNDYSYNFRLYIKDRVGQSITYYVIPKGIPALAIRKDKIGINTPDPQYALDVVGDINLTGKLLRNGVDLIYPVGSIYMSVNDIDPSTIFGGIWEPIQDRFLLAAGSVYEAGSTGGESEHTLTIDEIPAHDGHLEGNDYSSSGTDGLYLDKSSMRTYGTSGRGWTIQSVNEVVPAGVSKGGGTPHNNMPPYLAVYMWKRTS